MIRHFVCGKPGAVFRERYFKDTLPFFFFVTFATRVLVPENRLVYRSCKHAGIDAQGRSQPRSK